MLSMVDFPSVTQFYASSSQWGAPLFDELKPLIVLALGSFLVLVIIAILVLIIAKNLGNILHGKK